MKKIIRTSQYCFLLLLAILGGSGCKKQNVNPSGYLEYLAAPDNGLQQSICEKDFCYQLKYLPQAYFALRTLEDNPNQVGLDAALKEVANNVSFLLKIRGNNTQVMSKIKDQNKDSWEKTMNELRFNLQKKFELRLGQEIQPCVIYHLEQNAFAQEELQFLITFDIPDAKNKIMSNDLIFQFKDELLSKKELTLSIENKNIQQIPKIKF